MESTIRKLGNSAVIILPAPLLKSLNFVIGQPVEIKTDGKRLVIAPRTRKRYTAAELNAQCDLKAAMPDDLQEWERAPAVGSETL